MTDDARSTLPALCPRRLDRADGAGRAVRHRETPERPTRSASIPARTRSFTIYEDDNETYNYEKGARATVDIHWDDKRKTLLFGKRQGTFPGLVQSRTFNVVIASPANANGITEARSTKISYTGENLELKPAD